MPIPALKIDAPPLAGRRYPSLIQAATGPMDIPVHAQTSGAQWQSNACGSARLYPAACVDGAGNYPQVQLDAAAGLEDAFPFVVYASIECPAVGTTAERARQDVIDKLQATEPYAVEQAFWGGQDALPAMTGIVQQLTAQVPTGVTLLAGTAATVKEAVSKLEQQAAQSNYRGPLLLHVRPGIGAYLGGAGLLRTRVGSDGERQYTHYGSELVLGDGYAGSSPDDATAPDATTEYMMITGRIFLWRSEIYVNEAAAVDRNSLNRTTNQRALVAQRVYALGVECFAAAIKFTRA